MQVAPRSGLAALKSCRSQALPHSSLAALKPCRTQAMPHSSLGDADLNAPDAGELGNGGIAWMQRKLAHERTGHDDVAGAQASPVFPEFLREPFDRVQRIAEHR